MENIITPEEKEEQNVKNISMRDIWKKGERVGFFGISYLDKKLRGISKSDLIIIGARSGAGKTSVANRIFNVNNKTVKTKLFSLENFSGDLYSNNCLVNYRKITGQFITAREWKFRDFKLDDVALEQAEKMVKENMQQKYIVTRQPEYTVKKLKEDMIRCAADGYKLLIIDHLDYLEKENPTENDITHITELMRTIRQVQDNNEVAVVAVSHLRKPEGSSSKTPVIVPNENEFIGSSNKAKEATIVIMFAPDDEGNMNSTDKLRRKTWCCVRKNRDDGFDGRCANLTYDVETQSYLDNYTIHSVNYAGTKTILLQGEE